MDTITGVALRTADGRTYSLPAPNRHWDVIQLMNAGGISKDTILTSQQGFVTAAGVWLDRAAALDLALSTGQVVRSERSVPDLPELFSEDLW